MIVVPSKTVFFLPSLSPTTNAAMAPKKQPMSGDWQMMNQRPAISACCGRSNVVHTIDGGDGPLQASVAGDSKRVQEVVGNYYSTKDALV